MEFTERHTITATSTFRKFFLVFQGLAAIAVAWGIIQTLTRLMTATGIDTLTPSWDHAAHGVDGLILAHALRQWDLLTFFGQIIRMNYWPPGFPLSEVPAFLLFGDSYAVPRIWVTLLLGICISVGAVAGRLMTPAFGWCGGILIAALISTSPGFRAYGNSIMLEIPTTLLYILFFVCWIRYQNTRQQTWLRASCGAALALFFVKYNYAVLAVAPLLAYEFLAAKHHRDQLSQTLRQWHQQRLWARPFVIFAGCYLLLLLVILKSGGFVWDVAGHKILVQTIANPAYAFLVILALRLTVIRPREGKALWRWLRQLPEPYASFFWILVLPCCVWLLHPMTFRTFLNFMINESVRTDLSWWQRVIYYPQCLLDFYGPTPLLGIGLIVLALVGVISCRKSKFAGVAFAVSVALLACATHRNIADRYIFPMVPMLWLFALLGYLAVTERLRINNQNAAIALLFLAMGVVYKLPLSAATAAADIAAANRPAAISKIADSLCRASQYQEGTAVIGFWHELSPSLILWRCIQDNPRLKLSAAPRPPVRLGLSVHNPDFQAFLRDQKVQKIIIVDYQGPERSQYDKDVAWLFPLITLLRQQEQFALQETLSFPISGYRLEIYQRR